MRLMQRAEMFFRRNLFRVSRADRSIARARLFPRNFPVAEKFAGPSASAELPLPPRTADDHVSAFDIQVLTHITPPF
jgi:hypothetical protein